LADIVEKCDREGLMGTNRLRRPSVGAILGLLALIIAVAGNTDAFSAKKTVVIVHKGEIAKGAVTAKSLAPSAVRGGAIASGAVHARALAAGAVGAAAIGSGVVGSSAIAPDAVTAGTIAPGSIYGGALGAVTIHGAPIADSDETADLSTWSASNTVLAACAPGEHVISGGVVVTNAGNRRVGIIQSAPSVNGNSQGWIGQITSDAGGTAIAEVQALCLK
jgi:hypothetical protein